jgi:transcriptional regulator with XRE-family HTH domain
LEIVRYLREERDWSQTELAKRAGLDPAQISTLETGKRSPNIRTLHKVAAALEVDVTSLLGTVEQYHYRRYRETGDELLKQAHESLARAAEVVGPEEEFMKLPREEQDRRLDYAERFRAIADDIIAFLKEEGDREAEKEGRSDFTELPGPDTPSVRGRGYSLPGN